MIVMFLKNQLSFKRYFKTDFITRSDFNVTTFVEKECIALGIINFEIVSLTQDTRGQADTVKIGLEKFKSKKNEDLYIFNIDSIRSIFKAK